MDITEVSILHHVGIVLVALWVLSALNWCNTFAYFIAMVYLYLVHEGFIIRLRKKIQFEERKQAYQSRVLSDSETIRWLNHAIEKIWPYMEQIASQKILLPIIPWFLDKYKPWTVKKACVEQMYLGRNPPLFTEMRVLRQCNDDHLVLELGMNFLAADDMNAVLKVKLNKRLGFGIWAKMHITGMHVEGKVKLGVKFLPKWPFLGRLQLCFVEPPYFQMTIKPIVNYGIDVTEVPGISGWLDNLLSIAFEQTLVEPNMLVVDVERFVSPEPEPWFTIDEKNPVAYAKVEVVEASEIKAADYNGLSDPYVKGQLNGYSFRTKIQAKTLAPKWHEEFKIPIINWESSNVLAIEVCDKDHFYDDTLGDCSVNVNDFRDGQKHYMWLPLQNVKTGRLYMVITILDDDKKGVDDPCDLKPVDNEERSSFSVSSDKSPKVVDNFEPINIEGQKETGIWVYHPGSEVSRTWEPRKGKSRRLDTAIRGEPNNVNDKCNSPVSGSLNNNCSSPSNTGDKHKIRPFKRSLQKIGAAFGRSPKMEERCDAG